MQKVKLPKQLDPFKCAVQRSEYRGVFLSRDMTRFLDTVVSSDEIVDVDITFKKDEQGLTYFDGSISTSASLFLTSCQFHPILRIHANCKVIWDKISTCIHYPHCSDLNILNLHHLKYHQNNSKMFLGILVVNAE